MKQVHDKSMVAHLWANRSQDAARTAGNNFWFTGAKLFSYGPHFVCGYITDWKTEDGKTVYLMNDGSYSKTTARHMCEARNAARGLDRHQFGLRELTDNMLHSVYIFDNIAEQIEKDIAHYIGEAAGFRSEAKITRALNEARDAAELLRIMTAHAPDAATRKRLNAIAKRLPAIPSENTREAMKRIRDEIEKAKARKARDVESTSCITFYASAIGWCDANGLKVDGGNIKPSNSIYVRDAVSAMRAGQSALLARSKAEKAAKACGMSAPRGMPSAKKIRALICLTTPLAEEQQREEQTRGARWQLRDLFRDRNKPRRGDDKAAALAVFSRHGSEIENYTLSGEQRSQYTAEQRGIFDEFVRQQRRAFVASMAREIKRAAESIASTLASADSYLPQHPGDAAREYRRACADYVNASRKLNETEAGQKLRDWLEPQLPDCGRALLWLKKWDAEKAERNAAAIEAWRGGEGYATAVRSLIDYPMLRIVGERVQSSWGAEMPVAHARAVWVAVKAAKRSGVAWTCPPNEPVKMGSFSLNTARVDGSIVAGCHDIPANEVERIAVALGLTETAAA